MRSRVKIIYFWISVVYLLVPNIFCAQMKLVNVYNLGDNIFEDIYLEPEYQLPQFYECMRNNGTAKCFLGLTPDFSVNQVIKQNMRPNYQVDKFTYECSILKNNKYTYFYIECVPSRLQTTHYFCSRINCGGSQIFRLLWNYKDEYFQDKHSEVCNRSSLCSAHSFRTCFQTIKPFTTADKVTETPFTETTTLKIPDSTFELISTKQPTIESTNFTIDYDNVISTLLNNTVTLATHSSKNTKTIAISVGASVSVCFVIVLLIIIYCMRKNMNSKKENYPSAIYANDLSSGGNNDITILNDIIKCREHTISESTIQDSIKTVSQTYNEYNAYCSLPPNYFTNGYSTIEPSISLNKKKSNTPTNNHILEEQSRVYQNLNSATDTSLPEPYASHGEHIKVDEHCLLPEHNDTDINTQFADRVTDTSLTKPYARLGEHVIEVEHDYNFLLPEVKNEQNNGTDKTQPNFLSCTNLSDNTRQPESRTHVAGESPNPYSLAKVIKS